MSVDNTPDIATAALHQYALQCHALAPIAPALEVLPNSATVRLSHASAIPAVPLQAAGTAVSGGLQDVQLELDFRSTLRANPRVFVRRLAHAELSARLGASQQ